MSRYVAITDLPQGLIELLLKRHKPPPAKLAGQFSVTTNAIHEGCTSPTPNSAGYTHADWSPTERRARPHSTQQLLQFCSSLSPTASLKAWQFQSAHASVATAGTRLTAALDRRAVGGASSRRIGTQRSQQLRVAGARIATASAAPAVGRVDRRLGGWVAGWMDGCAARGRGRWLHMGVCPLPSASSRTHALRRGVGVRIRTRRRRAQGARRDDGGGIGGGVGLAARPQHATRPTHERTNAHGLGRAAGAGGKEGQPKPSRTPRESRANGRWASSPRPPGRHGRALLGDLSAAPPAEGRHGSRSRPPPPPGQANVTCPEAPQGAVARPTPAPPRGPPRRRDRPR
eukprot:scaffold7393_cov497-Prasinococcus_capsulatus_cf.AAC.4